MPDEVVVTAIWQIGEDGLEGSFDRPYHLSLAPIEQGVADVTFVEFMVVEQEVKHLINVRDQSTSPLLLPDWARVWCR